MIAAASLKEIIEHFETELVRDDTLGADAAIVDIASGGIQKRGGLPPVLCDDAELAIRLWRMASSEYAESQPRGTRFKWIERPVLDRWQITMTDSKFTHRLTSDRYVMFARIVVGAPTPQSDHDPLREAA